MLGGTKEARSKSVKRPHQETEKPPCKRSRPEATRCPRPAHDHRPVHGGEATPISPVSSSLPFIHDHRPVHGGEAAPISPVSTSLPFIHDHRPVHGGADRAAVRDRLGAAGTGPRQPRRRTVKRHGHDASTRRRRDRQPRGGPAGPGLWPRQARRRRRLGLERWSNKAGV